ncbi:type II secretion system protein [Candidatus Saccharibacteria bacterium]|nr:type II secretion system protein [Candidatus Saccharibacteria bacterium]
MKKGELKNNTGFTIIEVALVLAIAGLIFLMVFIALPGLRASQRDTSRRENIMSFLDNVKKFQNNNRGSLPSGSGEIVWGNWDDSHRPSGATWEGFYYDYFDIKRFEDPSGEYYKLSVMTCGTEVVGETCETYMNKFSDSGYEEVSFPNDYKMYVVISATCDGSIPVASNNPRKVAVTYRLEQGGFYCNNT